MTAIGSFCSGYGGLEMALTEFTGGEVVWQAENDKHAATILAARFPGVPNIGDITTTDWTQVQRVDWVCAGFPCQDLSYAGAGAGIKEGTRSGLWFTIADALGVLRPRHVLLENVAAIVARRPGLDVVAADLARLGFAAEWVCVRASDVGAPHRRLRWFCVATAGETRERQRSRQEPRDRSSTVATDASGGSFARVGAAGDGLPVIAEHRTVAAADTTCDGRDEGRPEPAGLVGRPDAAERSPVARHTAGGARDGASTTRSSRRSSRQTRGSDFVASDPHLSGSKGVGRFQPAQRDVDGRDSQDVAWGVYEPAVRRWEHALGRAAPSPTEPGRNGPRLSPRFVEWMQGLPEGWVIDVGIPRDAQLRALGNGVVPQQAFYALSLLCEPLAVAS